MVRVLGPGEGGLSKMEKWMFSALAQVERSNFPVGMTTILT